MRVDACFKGHTWGHTVEMPWTTSVWTQKPLACPRHAGHRCGMSAMRGWARVSKSSQTGIWLRNPHPTMRSISASTGDWYAVPNDFVGLCGLAQGAAGVTRLSTGWLLACNTLRIRRGFVQAVVGWWFGGWVPFGNALIWRKQALH